MSEEYNEDDPNCYQDEDGNKRSIFWMTRNRPDWAASIIPHLRRKLLEERNAREQAEKAHKDMFDQYQGVVQDNIQRTSRLSALEEFVEVVRAEWNIWLENNKAIRTALSKLNAGKCEEEKKERECETCWGRGYIYKEIKDPKTIQTCPDCNGTGKPIREE